MILRVVVFLCLFFYIYPIFLSFLPIPTDRILQVIGIVCILFTPKFSSQVFASRSIIKLILCALLVTFVGYVALLVNNSVDFYFIKYELEIVFHLFSAYLILLLFRQYKPNFTVVDMLDWIVIVTLAQALISFFFFIQPAYFKAYTSLLNSSTNQGLTERLSQINKRLLGVGTGFFNGVISYGVSLLITAALPYLPGSYFYQKNKVKYILCFILITVAGILTGRTFFFAILLVIIFWCFMEKQRLLLFIRKSFKRALLSCVMIFIAVLLFPDIIDSERIGRVLNFVFEIFVNYSETGELTTSSTERMAEMYAFPESLKTWVIGDGKMINENGAGYYKLIDIGFIRFIFYFGLVGLLIFLFSQYFYAKLIARLAINNTLKVLSLFLFFWVVVLNLKGIAKADLYFVLLLMSMVTTKNEK